MINVFMCPRMCLHFINKKKKVNKAITHKDIHKEMIYVVCQYKNKGWRNEKRTSKLHTLKNK